MSVSSTEHATGPLRDSLVHFATQAGVLEVFKLGVFCPSLGPLGVTFSAWADGVAEGSGARVAAPPKLPQKIVISNEVKSFSPME